MRNAGEYGVGSITFHTDSKRAHSHLDNHPEFDSRIVSQSDAITLADYAFGSLLAS